MNIRPIHFIRELLVTDQRGSQTPTMQYSCDNASYLHPEFLPAPTSDQAQLRAVYLELGGGRMEGSYSGSTVIIPNRSFWASMRPISIDEVQLVAGTDLQALSENTQG
jgi:hypothetical protein